MIRLSGRQRSEQAPYRLTPHRYLLLIASGKPRVVLPNNAPKNAPKEIGREIEGNRRDTCALSIPALLKERSKKVVILRHPVMHCLP